MAYVDEITPPQWKSTSLGLYAAMFSLGGMVNGVMNGFLLDVIRGGMYWVNAALMLLAMLLLILAGSKAGRPKLTAQSPA
jgi:MFS family permease